MNDVLPTSKKRIKHSREIVRVMLVDDSLVARSIISRILQRSHEIEIVFEAEDTESALEALGELEVDIILLDIEMPKRTGLDALPELLEKSAGASILVVSSFAEKNGPAAIEALSLGACDTLAKPGRSAFSGKFSQSLLDKVVYLARSNQHQLKYTNIGDISSNFALNEQPDCVAIGASTGGIPAIFEIVSLLDPLFSSPILITQHLPEAFMSFFARQLERHTDRKVAIAEDDMVIQDNCIYIASGNSHITCKKRGGKIRLETPEEYASSHYRPSVDAMFESVAAIFGKNSLSIILSGMGQDGLIGARKIAANNGNILAQDAETSVVWGMPGSIVRENLASAVLSPSEIAHLLNKMAGRSPNA